MPETSAFRHCRDLHRDADGTNATNVNEILACDQQAEHFAQNMKLGAKISIEFVFRIQSYGTGQPMGSVRSEITGIIPNSKVQ